MPEMLEPQAMLDQLVRYRDDRADEVHDCYNMADEAGIIAESQLVYVLEQAIERFADTYSLALPKDN